MRKTTAILAALLFLALAACAPAITEGEVIDKDNSYIQYISDGDGGTIPVSRREYIPPKWRVRIKGKNAEGETKTQWFQVSEGIYDSLELGDNYTHY